MFIHLMSKHVPTLRLSPSGFDRAPAKMVSSEKGEPASADFGSKKGLLDRFSLPTWLSDSFSQPRIWKNFARCMIVTFATMVLMLTQPCP